MSSDKLKPTRFIGLDLHKYYLVATGVDIELNKVYGPRRVDLIDLEDWIQKVITRQDALVVEATSNAFKVYDALAPHAHSVTIVHPPRLALIVHSQVKTDKIAATPDEIRLSALGYYMGLSEKGGFWIVLFYHEKGITVEYEGYMEKAKTLDICFSPNQLRAYSRILLWDPKLKYSFTKAGSLIPLTTKPLTPKVNDTEQDIQRDYNPISEVSDLDIQSFYDQYRQDANKGDCFQVPDLDWPIEK